MIVQKYGGTSVGTAARIKRVCRRIADRSLTFRLLVAKWLCHISTSRSVRASGPNSIRPVAQASQEFAQIFPAPGAVEHDPEAIWTSVVATMRDAMAKAGIAAKDPRIVDQQIDRPKALRDLLHHPGDGLRRAGGA